jgi:integrase
MLAGSIRQRGGSFKVLSMPGRTGVTGRDRHLTESVRGTDRAARNRPRKGLTRLQAEVVDKQHVPGNRRAAGPGVGRITADGRD